MRSEPDLEARIIVPVAPRLRKLEHLERALRRTAAGADLASAIEVHAGEVLDLVNTDRRVAVTWQRSQGPAFIRAVVQSGFDESVTIPRSVNGVRFEELLLRMADVLQRHGSAALRNAIADRSFQLLSWAHECESLPDLFRRLAADAETGSRR